MSSANRSSRESQYTSAFPTKLVYLHTYIRPNTFDLFFFRSVSTINRVQCQLSNKLLYRYPRESRIPRPTVLPNPCVAQLHIHSTRRMRINTRVEYVLVAFAFYVFIWLEMTRIKIPVSYISEQYTAEYILCRQQRWQPVLKNATKQKLYSVRDSHLSRMCFPARIVDSLLTDRWLSIFEGGKTFSSYIPYEWYGGDTVSR